MDIKKELEEVQKKIDKLKKRQENIEKIRELQEKHNKLRGLVPFNHSSEMY